MTKLLKELRICKVLFLFLLAISKAGERERERGWQCPQQYLKDFDVWIRLQKTA